MFQISDEPHRDSAGTVGSSVSIVPTILLFVLQGSLSSPLTANVSLDRE